MAFHPIDLTRWDRREYFTHYMDAVPCTYSLTVPLDVTTVMGAPLYPVMLWLLTRSVNAVSEFRTAIRDGLPGIYDEMHPAYTVMDWETKRFSSIWTPFDEDFDRFRTAYEADVAQYGSSGKLFPKAGQPENCFDVSMAPWLDFTAFHLHLYDSRRHTLPIFTLGHLEEREGKKLLPLAIQAHHAVCDGYHVGLFLEYLRQELADRSWAKA
ncbi:MAG: chloramphenicol O-acetyltransferase CatP [Clostridia bacterium]|nr:chloramphenicol O-acetyltransferase CatP [Clostridia bacterium]